MSHDTDEETIFYGPKRINASTTWTTVAGILLAVSSLYMLWFTIYDQSQFARDFQQHDGIGYCLKFMFFSLFLLLIPLFKAYVNKQEYPQLIIKPKGLIFHESARSMIKARWQNIGQCKFTYTRNSVRPTAIHAVIYDGATQKPLTYLYIPLGLLDADAKSLLGELNYRCKQGHPELETSNVDRNLWLLKAIDNN